MSCVGPRPYSTYFPQQLASHLDIHDMYIHGHFVGDWLVDLRGLGYGEDCGQLPAAVFADGAWKII